MASPIDLLVAAGAQHGRPARALVVLAHPDDEALLCGATITAMSGAGCEVQVVCCASWPRDRAEVFPKVCARLGASAELLDHRCGSMRVDSHLVGAVDELLRRSMPDVLITHSGSGPQHQDHQALYEAVRLSVGRWPGPSLVLGAEPPAATVGFAPNVLVDVGATFDDKLDAVDQYRHVIDRRYMTDDYLVQRAQWWGTVSGHPGRLCEAYELICWR